MANRSSNYLVVVLLLCIVRISNGRNGDADPTYRDCLIQCEQTGCVEQHCFSTCKPSSVQTAAINGNLTDLYLKWKQSCCRADCRYYCIQRIENDRRVNGHPPIKYHSKWPVKRLFGLEEPASVAFCAMNLCIHLFRWLSFRSLVNHGLPMKQKKRPFYEFATLWQLYGLLNVTMWIFSTMSHTRDVEITKRVKFCCSIAAIGYSLAIAIIRSFGVRNEAARVMVLAPLLAFSTTHILFLNNYEFNYEWNHKVCTAMEISELLIWALWSILGRHPARRKVWAMVAGSSIAMVLEAQDFPPYDGIFDGHSLSLAAAVPVSYIRWSFILEDAKFLTSIFVKKTK